MKFNSVNKILESSFRSNWERDALSNYKGSTLTYRDVATGIRRMQLLFEKCGIVKGDKIAVCSRNQANWGVCFLAALTYGAVPVPLLHEFKPENIHYLVNHSDARLLFVGDNIWENLSETEMPELLAIVSVDSLNLLFSRVEPLQFLSEAIDMDFDRLYPGGLKPEDLSYYEDEADELAMINYTSGTSGFSKGVMLSYRNLYANLTAAKEEAEPQMTCESEVVSLLPSAHMYGMMFEFLFEMTIGAHVYFLTRVPSPKVILGAFAEVHPDIIISVPLIIEKVYKSKLKPLADRTQPFIKLPLLGQAIQKKFRDGLIEAFGGRFEEIILGGAPFNPEVEAFLRTIHFPFTVGYGMTECAPLVTYCKWYKTRKGSCGKPIRCCQVRIDSKNPHKIPGEIQIKGDNVFMGYYKNRQATAASFTNDNWLKTGDMGIIDADGYVYLKGRSKCMILGPSGQNIYPEELEGVINNVNYVVDSLVIEDDGGLTALIFPDYRQAEMDGLSAEDLETKIRDTMPEVNKKLPVYANIRKIEFMPEDFERTPKRSIKRYLYQRN